MPASEEDKQHFLKKLLKKIKLTLDERHRVPVLRGLCSLLACFSSGRVTLGM
jgi:hypothetical protein